MSYPLFEVLMEACHVGLADKGCEVPVQLGRLGEAEIVPKGIGPVGFDPQEGGVLGPAGQPEPA